MTKPYFSIIMPVHNAGRHLTATIESVLQQSEADFELIMIDDGSDDDSLSIMLKTAETDDRIRLLSQANRGVSETRNLGIDMARGHLIAFLDADDLWYSDKLAQHRILHGYIPGLAVSYAQVAFMENDAVSSACARSHSTVPCPALTVPQLLCENPVCTMSNVVVRADILHEIGGFRADMSFAEDQEWLIRIAAAGHQIQGIEQSLVAYRMSPEGLSINLPAMHEGWRKMALACRAPDGNSGSAGIEISAEALRRAEAIYCRYLARRALRGGANARTALHYAKLGLSLDRAAFMSDAKRGWLTLISALASAMMPQRMRIQIFA